MASNKKPRRSYDGLPKEGNDASPTIQEAPEIRNPEDIEAPEEIPLDRNGFPDARALGIRVGESPPSRPDLIWRGKYYQSR